MCDEFGSVAWLFPRNATGSLDHPGRVAFQAVPTALTLVAWVALEIAPSRRSSRCATRTTSAILSLLSLAAIGAGVWRVFDILECEKVPDVGGWRLLAAVGAPLGGLVSVFIVSRRFPRISALACLGAAGSAVFVDWTLRRVASPLAAQPMAGVQHLWCILVICSLIPLGPKRTRAGRNTFKWPSFRRHTAPPPRKSEPPDLWNTTKKVDIVDTTWSWSS